MAVIAAPKFKRSVEFCGMAGPVDGVADGQTCHRLPMHHGEHNAFVRGNGVAKKVAPKRAAKKKVVTRTVKGTKYRQSVGKNGVITLTPVTPPIVEAPVAPTKSHSGHQAQQPAHSRCPGHADHRGRAPPATAALVACPAVQRRCCFRRR